MKLNNLYFGVKYFDSNKKEMVTTNLFDIPAVKWAVAYWVAYPHYRTTEVEGVFFDVRARAEWEWLVNGFCVSDDNREGQKVDVYSMYVEPNIDYLDKLVNSVSKSSALEYVRQERKRYSRSTK